MAIGYADKKELMKHCNHDIEIAYYGDIDNPISVTIECMDCYEVLIDTEDGENENE